MVTYEEFKELMKEKAEEVTGEHVVINRILKNNGLVLDGMLIISAESNINPTIYLNGYYNDFKERMDIEEDPVQAVWESIYSIYKKHLPKNNFDTARILDFENVRNLLAIKIVNYAKNTERLEELSHIKFLDLAITFYINVNEFEGLDASITVQKYMQEIWGKSEEELLTIAKENMKHDYMLKDMQEVLDSMGTDIDIEDAYSYMYVLSNNDKFNGAASILLEDAMEEVGNVINTQKVIIIPSSIHEVLVIPMDEQTDIEYINDTIREINENHVCQEEYLSDHVYIFDKETKRIYA